jgi:hypothetical protein
MYCFIYTSNVFIAFLQTVISIFIPFWPKHCAYAFINVFLLFFLICIIEQFSHFPNDNGLVWIFIALVSLHCLLAQDGKRAQHIILHPFVIMVLRLYHIVVLCIIHFQVLSRIMDIAADTAAVSHHL